MEAGYSSPTEAARAMRVNQHTYTSHENGNRALSRSAADKYAAKLNVRAGWLLYGEAGEPPEPIPDAPEGYGDLTDADRAIVDRLIRSLLAEPSEGKR